MKIFSKSIFNQSVDEVKVLKSKLDTCLPKGRMIETSMTVSTFVDQIHAEKACSNYINGVSVTTEDIIQQNGGRKILIDREILACSKVILMSTRAKEFQHWFVPALRKLQECLSKEPDGRVLKEKLFSLDGLFGLLEMLADTSFKIIDCQIAPCYPYSKEEELCAIRSFWNSKKALLQTAFTNRMNLRPFLETNEIASQECLT